MMGHMDRLGEQLKIVDGVVERFLRVLMMDVFKRFQGPTEMLSHNMAMFIQPDAVNLDQAVYFSSAIMDTSASIRSPLMVCFFFASLGKIWTLFNSSWWGHALFSFKDVQLATIQHVKECCYS
jgi:hypothetical protein